MVGGTFSNFIMARFNADGTLDENFGDSGKVTTPIPGADALGVTEALAVAIQRDGKIVVAGDARTPGPGSRAAIVLVRYDSDGSLDNSFGAGGFVFGPTFLFGRAFAVAIDGDDRIVVAGDTPKAGNTDFGDFIVARFNANGSIDYELRPGRHRRHGCRRRDQRSTRPQGARRQFAARERIRADRRQRQQRRPRCRLRCR